jgi:hypothetical protein
MRFLVLVIDDKEKELHQIALHLRTTLQNTPSGSDVRLSFLAAPSRYAEGISNPRTRKAWTARYDAVWTLDAHGTVSDEALLGHWVVFSPFRWADQESWAFLDKWDKTAFLGELDAVVMDCNLSGTVDDAEAIYQGVDLLEKLATYGLPSQTLKILYSGNRRIRPERLKAVEPAIAVGRKDLTLLYSLIADRYASYRSVQAGRKPAGIPLQYAMLHNSASGAEIGHGLSEVADSDLDTSEKVRIAKIHIENTHYRLRHLATRMTAGRFATSTLALEASRVTLFRQALDQIAADVAASPGPLRDVLARFDSAFRNEIPIEKAIDGDEWPWSYTQPVCSFEAWRRALCRVYLSHQQEEESWIRALGRLIRLAGDGKWSVEVSDTEDENVEVFVPQEWLVELFDYLRNTSSFLKNHARATCPVRFVVRAVSWPENASTNGDTPKELVYKAGLIVGYAGVELPPDFETRRPRALNKLLEGPFAIESATQIYDLYAVRRGQSGVDVYEFVVDRENSRLKPTRRTDGCVPVWTGSRTSELETTVTGEQFLAGDLTSAIVFLFESMAEPQLKRMRA